MVRVRERKRWGWGMGDGGWEKGEGGKGNLLAHSFAFLFTCLLVCCSLATMGLDISLLYPFSPLAFFFIMGGGRNWEIQKRLEIPHNEDTGKKTFHFGFPHNAKRIERASEWDEISCRLHTIDMGLDWIGFTGRLACLYFWVAIILSTAS